MKAAQHVRCWTDRDSGPAHGLVADDDRLEEVVTRRSDVFGYGQCRGYDDGARMVDCFLVYIVEFERVGGGAVGERSHRRRRATIGADHRASPIAAGGQSMAVCCLRPRLVDTENDAAERVEQCVIGLSQ